jgi:peroxiredoxin
MPAVSAFPAAPVFRVAALFAAVVAASVLLAGCWVPDGPPPETAAAVGGVAHDFTLRQLDGRPVQLSRLTERGRVVLVVLRGYPGYQCPFCQTQVGTFLAKAKEFASAGAQVVIVYPGQAKRLGEFGAEFLAGRDVPANMHFVLDPDFAFAETYGLRWRSPGETVYPATYVIDGRNRIAWAKVSGGYANRASAEEVLAALKDGK